jgi:hypothetical protein
MITLAAASLAVFELVAFMRLVLRYSDGSMEEFLTKAPIEDVFRANAHAHSFLLLLGVASIAALLPG